MSLTSEQHAPPQAPINLESTSQLTLFMLVFCSALAADAPDTTITQKVFFDISVGGQPAGRIVLGMFGGSVHRRLAVLRAHVGQLLPWAGLNFKECICKDTRLCMCTPDCSESHRTYPDGNHD